MNRIYRLVWSRTHCQWVVADERSKAQGKSGGGRKGSLAKTLMGTVALASSLAAADAPPAPDALPQGGVVVAGSAQIGTPAANQMHVLQSSDQAVINWNSFDIGSQAKVEFVQPSASSAVLNRVITSDVSQIAGQMTANGKVYIVNPNGIVFANGSQVNTAALVASTLDIADDDFMAGRQEFTRGTATGEIRNEGSLNAESGGYVALLGARVVNNGDIHATGGRVVLAAGDHIQLPLTASGNITLAVDPATVNAAITNGSTGIITATDGQVYLSAAAASGLAAQVVNEGQISARDGGSVTASAIQSDGLGETLNKGSIDVGSDSDKGGDVTLGGDRIGLLAGSEIQASGAIGGGEVLVGGDERGQGSLHQADVVYMHKDATIDASATVNGDGGKVVLWSQSYTGFYGDISAKGGISGGDGGMVETSSFNNLQAFGNVDAAAPLGDAGQWLLDPTDVTIVAGAVDTNDTAAGGIWTPTTNTASIGVDNINTQLNAGTNVVIETASGGAGIGNITQNAGANIAKTAGANTTLTMNATGAITINGNISSTVGTLATTLNAAGGAITGTGTINTNGGLLTLNAASGSGTLSGVISGAGGLTKTGAGTTILNATNTYTGATSVNAGTLQVGVGTTSGAIAGASAVNVAAGATMTWDNNNSTVPKTLANNIGGAGTVLLKGRNATTALNNGQYTLSGNNAGLTGTIQLDRALLWGNTLQSQLGSATIEVGDRASISFNGSTFTNNLVIQNGAGWHHNVGSDVVLGAIRLEGNNTLSGNIQLNTTTSVVLGDNTGANSTIGSWGGGSNTLSGVISGAGDFAMSRFTSWNGGSGAVTNIILSGAQSNTYTGKTVLDGQGGLATLTLAKTGGAVAIAAGTTVQMGSNTSGQANLRMGADNQFSAGVEMNWVNVNGQWMRFDLMGTQQTLAGLTSANAGAGVIQNGGINTNTAVNGTLTLNGTGTYSYNGYIRNADGGGGTGLLNLVKSGTGSQTLAGNIVNYTGTTMVNAGTLDFRNLTAYNSLTTVAAGATLITSGTSHVGTGANGRMVLDGGTYNHTASNWFVWTGGLTVNSASTINVANSGINNQVFFNGPTFSGSGDLTINNTGATTTGVSFRGSAASTYSGNLTVNGGKIATQGNVFAFDNASVTLNNANWYMDGSQFATTAANDRVRSLNGNGNVFTGALTLTVGTNNGSGSFSGVISGTNGKLIKTGTGTQILTGNNTYTGLTTVSGGTLQIGNGGTTGTLGTGAVTDNATLIFNRSNTYTISNAISGTGTLSATSGDNLTIGGAINLTGNVTLTAGNDDAVAAPGVANGSVTGGDVTLNAAVNSTGGGNTVTIYSGNATTAAYIARVTGSSTSLNKVYATDPGLGTDDTSKKLNVFYRVSPTATLSLAANNRAYDGTTTATFNAAGSTVTGIDGDSLSASVTSGSFIDKDAANGKLVAFNGVNVASNAAGRTVSGYTLNTTDGTGNITPVDLTVHTNSDAKFVTKADIAGYAGASYIGFVNGETVGDLGGALNIARTNAGVEGAGHYADVLQASGLTSTNYNITYESGNYNIVAANELLVKLNNITGNYGTSANYSVLSAEYMLPNGTVIPLLSNVNDDEVTVDDGISSVTFRIISDTPSTSTSGNLNAGSHQLTNGAVTGSSTNFSNNLVVIGDQIVNPLAVTLAPGGVSKVYDGTQAMTGLTLGLNGLVAGDLVTASGNGSFDSKNVGTGLDYSVSNLGLGGADGANYILTGGTSYSGNNGIITPATLTFTAAANSKTYDATTNAAASPTISGLMGGDSVTSLSQYYADKNVGTNKTLVVDTGYVINDGNGGSNYAVSRVNRNTGTITPATLTLTAASNTKTYDGSVDSAETPTTSGLFGTDSVTGLTQSFADRHAGTGKTLIVGGSYTVNDGNGGNNYTVNLVNTTTGTITPATLTLTAASDSKVYDGTVDSNGAPVANGLVGADSVTGLNQTYDDKDAGTSKTLIVDGGFTINDGNGGNNYAVNLINNTTGVITPATLTVHVNNDARFVTQTDTAGYTGVSYTGFVNGETVAELSGSANIIRSNAAVQAAGHYEDVLQATGLTSTNYTFSYESGDYDIVAANELLVKLGNLTNIYGSAANYSVLSAEYLLPDGTIVALPTTVSNGQVTVNDSSGGVAFRITPDNAATSTSGNLRIGSYQLGGSDVTGSSVNFSNNLVVIGSQTVDAREVTLNPGGVSKVYDGTVSMTGLSLNLSGLITDDLVRAQGDGNFDSKHAGTGIGYSVSNLRLTGTDSTNYVLRGGGSLSGSDGTITPATLTLTAASNSKIYDTTTTAAALPTASGLVSGDTVNGLSQRYADKNAGTDKTLLVDGSYIINDGNNGNNYSVNLVNSNTGVITPAELTLTATANSKIYDATTNAAATPLVSGLLGSDGITGLRETYGDKHVGIGKAINVTGYTINDGNGGANYQVRLVGNSDGVIEARQITVAAPDNASKYHDGNTSVPAEYAPVVISGGVGEGVKSGELSYETPDIGGNKTVNIANVIMDDDNSGQNYIVTTQPSQLGTVLSNPVVVPPGIINPVTINPIDNPIDVPVVVVPCVSGGCNVRLSDIRAQVPGICSVTAISGQDLPAGITYDPTSGELRIGENTVLPPTITLHLSDCNSQQRAVRIQLGAQLASL